MVLTYSADLLQRATRMDFENYLKEDILVKIDRASMLNSLEIRAPLLDYRIVEFAFGKVPSYLKATPTSRKILLKHLCDRVLPPVFNRQRKQSFSIPLPRWLEHGRWLDFFREVLLDSHRRSVRPGGRPSFARWAAQRKNERRAALFARLVRVVAQRLRCVIELILRPGMVEGEVFHGHLVGRGRKAS